MDVFLILLILICTVSIERPYKLIVIFFLLIHFSLLAYNITNHLPEVMWKADPHSFLIWAKKLTTGSDYNFFGGGVKVYIYWLYFIFSYTFFLSYAVAGQLASVLAWLITILLIIKLGKVVNIYGVRMNLVLFLYCINPYDIILTTGTFREPYMIMFIMMTCYFAIKLYRQGGFINLLALLLSSLLASISHGGTMAAMAVFLLFLMLTYIARVLLDKELHKSISIFIFLITSVIGWYLISYFYPDYFHMIVSYSSKIPEASSSYPLYIADKTYFSVILSWLYYMFYPFIWDVRSFVDIYAFMIGLLRFVLLYYSVKCFFLEADIYQKRYTMLSLMLFLFITLIYAIGTANYGTSMRHNILTFWIICIFGVKGMYLSKRKICI